MGVVIPAGFGLLSFHTTTELDAEEMIWTVGLDLQAANDESQVPQLASEEWGDHLAALTSTIVTLQRTVLKVGPTTTGPTFQWLSGLTGDHAGALLPPNCAVLAQKRTLIGGRQGRGRAYIPGLSNIASTLDSGGNFGSVAQGEIQTALNVIQADMATDTTAGPVEMVLLHSDALAPTVITSWSVSRKIATQRRRLRP